jgi:hypothetical protein
MGSFISTAERKTDHHCPTLEDVFAVRRSLLVFVPVELANLILNEANYWPKATLNFDPEDPLVLSDRDATVCCLVTSKIRDLLLNGPYMIVKMIRFKIVSHDQGWCDENHFSERYKGSYTWFEAIIVRDFIQHTPTMGPSDETEMICQALDHRGLEGDNNYNNCEVVTVKTPDDEKCDTWKIQRNERASGEYQLHTVIWTEEEEEVIDESILMNETGRGLGRGFVRSLKKDDRIAIMARAEFPGWVNHIKSIELEIYYSA